MKFLIFIVLILSFLAPVNGQLLEYTNGTCTDFQTLEYPEPSDDLWCSAYSQSTCCNAAADKVAYTYAVADRGCDILYGQCLQYSIDISCFVTCSPKMWINITVGSLLRPVVCQSWAEKIWEACFDFSWYSPAAEACVQVNQYTYLNFAEQILGVDVVSGSSECTSPNHQPRASSSPVIYSNFIYVLLLPLLFSGLSLFAKG